MCTYCVVFDEVGFRLFKATITLEFLSKILRYWNVIPTPPIAVVYIYVTSTFGDWIDCTDHYNRNSFAATAVE